jgi:hydroxymethylpyrimidine pyrophosphatase-like HAD family hydrolase
MATLYVTDLDGTLIRDDLTLSPEARTELCALLAEGAPITVASACSVTSIRVIPGDITFPPPIVEFNGAFLSEYRTGRHEIVNAIPAPIARDVFEAMRAGGCTPCVSAFDGERVAFKDERLARVDDLGMLRAADRPIAMANAKPGVKALTREVIGTNNEDSVVRAIRQDWSEKAGR